ncbi:MAG: transporter permease [Solirubrobacterales bacterium]|jgi:osmoprotectant transport system permease protein|nr:transporter permease [Solirubrobacterales bacterium]
MTIAAAIGPVLAQLQIHDRGAGTKSGESCVADNGFCPDWIIHNFSRYETPFWQHVYLSVVAVLLGFIIAFGLSLLAHERRWLVGPIVGVTGVLYTLPSIAVFFLLQPLTGRGALTALIALTAYTLLILFRNIITGLNNVPADTIDAARGIGYTDRQVLWRVELPLALPEIIAGLRIAATTTVGLATLAFFAGAGGLGGEIFADITFKSNVIVAGGLCLILAIVFDVILLGTERLLAPWQRATSTGTTHTRRRSRRARPRVAG